MLLLLLAGAGTQAALTSCNVQSRLEVTLFELLPPPPPPLLLLLPLLLLALLPGPMTRARTRWPPWAALACMTS
jgi:hypothetical protein